MKLTTRLAVTLSACGLAASALAQDSVSPAGALPGDALEVYDASEACNSYVVDAVDFTGSWGTALRIAPVLKAPRMPNSQFFNNLISPQAISADTIAVQAYPSASYDVWTTAGTGINDLINFAPGSTSPSGSSRQFAVGFSDFGTSGEGASYNGVHGAIVNVDPSDDGRLYVHRVSTAINGSDGNNNNSQFGFGVVDANGNSYVRADDFGLGGDNEISGNNIFRVRMLDRDCDVLNDIGGSGGSDAGSTDFIVAGSGDTHAVPHAIPASVAGRPVYGGPDFNAQYVYESTPNSTSSTSSHLQGATDSRGTFGVSLTPWFDRPGAVATFSQGTKSSGGATDSFSIWDVDTNGAVLNPGALVTVPATVTDLEDGFEFGLAGGAGLEFDGYHSQHSFRGGSGLIALTVDAAGNRLAAGTVYDLAIGGNDNPSNAVAVAKYDVDQGRAAWSVAGYYDTLLDEGKEILDGPGGNVIGQMTGMFNVTGGAPLGPSISAPAFDCAGNVYFVAAVELFGDLGSDFDVALVRAIYDEATFSYELELLATSGDVFTGANSATDYSITFIDLADSNSLSSGAFYSSNVTQTCWNGADKGDLDGTTDPAAVGGVVLNARITYDTDGDGFFDNALDENYRTLLLITGTGGASDPCDAADCDENGVVDTRDVLCFLNLWNAGDEAADCDENGVIDTRDVLCYLNLWNACR